MTKKRVKLDLDEFAPGAAEEGPDKATLIAATDAVAAEHGFTSREAAPEKPKRKTRRQGRPRIEGRRQITISSTDEMLEWFNDAREKMGWSGGKMFEEMRAAWEEANSDN